MVVGNGLIANTLSEFENNKDVLIFASGVSNSSDFSSKNFEREEKLLLQNANTNKMLFYFSTCSVYDVSLEQTPYVKHKKRMEELVEKNFLTYCIMRLPTLVGKTNNSFTFFNNFKSKLKKGDKITVFKNATRYLFDVDALPSIISLFMSQNNKNVINVAFDNKVSVVDIVDYMKFSMQTDSIVEYVDRGFDISIDNKEFIGILTANNFDFAQIGQDYKNIIDKYIHC